MQGDLRKIFYHRQFFIKCSFVHVIIEISKLFPDSVGPFSPTVQDAVELKQY
jgi:hypothetical protein